MNCYRIAGVVTATVLFASSGWVAEGRVLPHTTNQVAQDQRIPGVLVVNLGPDVARPERNKGALGDAAMGIASIDELNADHGMFRYRRLFPGSRTPGPGSKRSDLTGFYVLEFPQSSDLDQLKVVYEADPNVAWVEFDYYATIMRIPNDTYWTSLWGLRQSQDHDIDADEAWDRVAGDSSVVIADSDTGVLWDHPDLAAAIWINPGEDIDGDGVLWDTDDFDLIDNDGNGYIDDVIGYDFVASGTSVWPGEDGSVKDNNPSDFNGHGTHTSGTIGAVTNNNLGVSGVAGGFGAAEPGCRIMCLRQGYSFNDGGWENGRTHMSYVAEALNYAANNGAVSFNYSFGSSNGGGVSTAATNATAADVVICASAGNSNGQSFGYLQSRADVICVASTTSNDTKSWFSNYGTAVDVSAPGSSIRSTVSNHYSPGYAYYDGTSMSAPHVTGLAGLIRSVNPNLTHAEVFALIVDGADNIDALNPSYVGKLGSGRINANTSTNNIAPTDFAATPTLAEGVTMVQFTDQSTPDATAWRWSFGDGDTSAVQNPSHLYQPGLYDVELRITAPLGEGVEWKPNFVTVLADTMDVADTSGLRGSGLYMEIVGTNAVPLEQVTLPVIFSNVPSIVLLDSISTAGCRTAYFEDNDLIYDNRFAGELCARLTADVGGGSAPLPPGTGPIARVYLRIAPGAAVGGTSDLTVGTLGGFDFEAVCPSTGFAPVFNGGTVTVSAAIGDLNLDGGIDVLDVIALIDYVFRSGTPPNPLWLGNTNCQGDVDVLDVVLLIDHVFRSGPEPCAP